MPYFSMRKKPVAPAANAKTVAKVGRTNQYTRDRPCCKRLHRWKHEKSEMAYLSKDDRGSEPTRACCSFAATVLPV
jgi:hypothetical protein